jgi:hypothetical protein
MRKLTRYAVALFAAALAACSSSGGDSSDSGGGGFPQPAGTVAVNFTVDDTANHVYANGDLEWKGAMQYVTTTRKVSPDATWTGPFARLYDDGPWTAGGHEPVGAVAGDHRLGVTVFVTPPAVGSQLYEYGLNDRIYQAMADGNGWVWVGSNGTFSVAAGATATINASGMTFPAFGTHDLRLTLDPTAIASASDFDLSVVKVKGSATAWTPVLLTTTAVGGPYVFTLSSVVGAGHTFNHSGLLNTGDRPEFIYMFGATAKEYKDASGWAHLAGITAEVKPAGGSFAPVTVTTITNKNTAVLIP